MVLLNDKLRGFKLETEARELLLWSADQGLMLVSNQKIMMVPDSVYFRGREDFDRF